MSSSWAEVALRSHPTTCKQMFNLVAKMVVNHCLKSGCVLCNALSRTLASGCENLGCLHVIIFGRAVLVMDRPGFGMEVRARERENHLKCGRVVSFSGKKVASVTRALDSNRPSVLPTRVPQMLDKEAPRTQPWPPLVAFGLVGGYKYNYKACACTK